MFNRSLDHDWLLIITSIRRVCAFLLSTTRAIVHVFTVIILATTKVGISMSWLFHLHCGCYGLHLISYMIQPSSHITCAQYAGILRFLVGNLNYGWSLLDMICYARVDTKLSCFLNPLYLSHTPLFIWWSSLPFVRIRDHLEAYCWHCYVIDSGISSLNMQGKNILHSEGTKQLVIKCWLVPFFDH
jgi:hypothetical protein